ncbi:hypothetical protein NX059_002330 [Plenodomus lindquistii]|nr:hypothetical protein NX059_002330 [Plenodomus lindquistii]
MQAPMDYWMLEDFSLDPEQVNNTANTLPISSSLQSDLTYSSLNVSEQMQSQQAALPVTQREFSSPTQIMHDTPHNIRPTFSTPTHLNEIAIQTPIAIGTIFTTSTPSKYTVKCTLPRCGKTFGRPYDFYRHFNGTHVMTEFHWCPQEDCLRNAHGNQPFPRRDKVKDHLRQAHGIE